MSTHLVLKQLSGHIVFRLLHYTFISLQLRHELSLPTSCSGKLQGTFSSRSACWYREWQPFVLWLTNLLLTFAGDILVNLLLGNLPLEPLSNSEDICLCTLSWYLVFYCPFDGIHIIIDRTVLIKMLAAPVLAISQVLHIDRGVQLAEKVYGKNAMVPILIIGTVIGSGAEFLKPIAALLINRCQHSNAAYVKLSTNSKVSLLISWIYQAQSKHSRQHMTTDLDQQRWQNYLLFALILFKYLSLYLPVDHFICLMERRICYAFFGGLHADLNKFCKRKNQNSFAKFDWNCLESRWRRGSKSGEADPTF